MSEEEMAAKTTLAPRLLASPIQPKGTVGGFSVDPASREQARLFHRLVYSASDGVDMAWTGDYSSSDAVTAAGDTAQAHKDAVNLRVNYYRAFAGVPAWVAFSETYSAKDRLAAIMMSVNNALSHYPSSSWTLYTADGYEAAHNSNLALGIAGPEAIDGYMADPGSGNTAVGHRRWVFYPQTRTMGTGDVPGDTTYADANALWVIDDYYGTTRPTVRDTFVAWPPEGYVPYEVVWPRWSFSYPGANFSSATVTMDREGTSVAVTLETVANGYGENTLAWIYDNQDSDSQTPHARPSSDTTYNVTISNVVISGQTRSFSYQVIVFDPDEEGADSESVDVSGAASAMVGVATEYSVSGLTLADGFQWRTLTTASYSEVEGAENGTGGVVDGTSTSYDLILTGGAAATGTHCFHMAHPSPAVDQDFELAESFLASASAQLSFKSRLGYATDGQVAHVQVSLDEGTSWTDLYTQAGTGTSGESSYTTRSISLAGYDGRVLRVRFAYTVDPTAGYYYQTTSSVGWLIDDITITGVGTVTAGTESVTISEATFSYTPTTEGAISLQARGVFFGAFPGEWGPVKDVTVSALVGTAPSISVQPIGTDAVTGSDYTLSVTATGVPDPTYVWRKDGSSIDGATAAWLTLTDLAASDAGDYTVVVTNAYGTVTSDAAVITVSDPLSITGQPGNAFIAAGETATVSVTAAGSNLSYQWYSGTSGDTSEPVVGATTATLTTSALAADSSYWVRVQTLAESVDSDAAIVTVLDGERYYFGSIGSPAEGAFGLHIDASGTCAIVVVLPERSVRVSASDVVIDETGAFAVAMPDDLGTLSGWIAGEDVGGTIDGPGLVLSGTMDASGGATSDLAGVYDAFLLYSAAGEVVCMVGPSGSALVVVDNGGTIDGGVITITADGVIQGTLDGGSSVDLTIASTHLVSGTITASGGSELSVAGAGTDVAQDDRLGNVSMRAQVEVGDSIMIAGFVINGTGTKQVLIRGVGPTLASFGVTTALSDAEILVYRQGTSSPIAQNDDWGLADNADEIESTAAALWAFTLPADSADAAVLLPLSAGSYTTHVRGVGGVTGTSLVEIYDADTLSGETPTAELVNISLRGEAGVGNNIVIAGFIVTGTTPKRVLVRGVGPELEGFGLTGVLDDPIMRVYRRYSDPTREVLVATNDDWGDDGMESIVSEVGDAAYAFSLTSGSKSAAMVLWLEPGAYTAQVASNSGTPGIAITEVYQVE